ncbi:MAG: hypothetical protein JSU62_02775 [Gammaproteobacteria bacterium]|nr:MAG: hypothetical protein JSU62_02775 [Gammaproteobacteria bacterium]
MTRSKRFVHLLSFAVALMGALFAIPSVADDVSEWANGEWLVFGWYGDSDATGCRPADPDGAWCYIPAGSVPANNPPWEVTVEYGGSGTITVVDAFMSGDQFEIFDNYMSLGLTSAPGSAYCGTPDQCIGMAEMSAGVFELTPGYHAITIGVVLNPFYVGAAFFRVDGDIVGAPPPIQDTDGDGVYDDEDQCIVSDLNPTVAIGDCDSGVVNTLYVDGCTIADRLQECGNGVRNHGLRVSCTADLLNEMMKSYEIEKVGAIQRCVAQDN